MMVVHNSEMCKQLHQQEIKHMFLTVNTLPETAVLVRCEGSYEEAICDTQLINFEDWNRPFYSNEFVIIKEIPQ